MGLLKRYKYHILAAVLLMALALAGARTKMSEMSHAPQELPRIQSRGQLEHALELFPRSAQASLLSIDSVDDQRPFILNFVRESLATADQDKAYEISRAVIAEANHHGMDPFFLLAVIQTESQFNFKARGTHGEIGLMQILPDTAKWLAPQAGLDSGKINLENPSMNIRLGATYLAHLRKTFNKRGSRYVSAYNMGSANVRRLVRSQIEPYIYSGKVLANYVNLYARIEKAQTGRDIASVNLE